MINPTIFRKYDIRGIVNKDFTAEESALIAHGIWKYAKEQNIQLRTIVVGRDARVHSAEIFKNITTALKSLGVTIIDIGIVTTPILYFTIHTTPDAHGIMITASHNPGEYNGFKICFNKKSLHGPAIERLKELTPQTLPQHHGEYNGTTLTYDALSRYIDGLALDFEYLSNKKMHIIFDCNHGPAALVIPKLIEKLKWKNCSAIHTTLDGTFPHQKPDPTVEKNGIILKEHLSKQTAPTIGIGFDGDADRMSARDESGALVSGDILLALMSKNVLAHFPNARIVFDIKSSSALSKMIINNGGTPIMSPTGHSNIKVTMAQHKALLGGELSGHFFFADKSYGYDDGIYAAMRLIELLDETENSLQHELKQIPESTCSPEFRIPCAEEEKEKIITSMNSFFKDAENTKLSAIDGIRIENEFGWGLVRPSNTEPVISLRFEGTNIESLNIIKKDVYGVLEKHLSKEVLLELC